MIFRSFFVVLFFLIATPYGFAQIHCEGFLREPGETSFANGYYDLAREARELSGRIQGMASGNKTLATLLEKYGPELGTHVLEIGPFYSPLLVTNRPLGGIERDIFYWELDAAAIEHPLAQLSGLPKRHPIQIDLNSLDSSKRIEAFLRLNQRRLDEAHGESFNTVVVSQVMNYLNDFSLVLRIVSDLQKPGDLIFSNEVLNYGTPQREHFAAKRPNSIYSISDALKTLDYEIVERIHEPLNSGIFPRVILVARKLSLEEIRERDQIEREKAKPLIRKLIERFL